MKNQIWIESHDEREDDSRMQTHVHNIHWEGKNTSEMDWWRGSGGGPHIIQSARRPDKDKFVQFISNYFLEHTQVLNGL